MELSQRQEISLITEPKIKSEIKIRQDIDRLRSAKYHKQLYDEFGKKRAHIEDDGWFCGR